MNRCIAITLLSLCLAAGRVPADRVWLRNGRVLDVEVLRLEGDHAVVSAPWLEGTAEVPVDKIQEWACDTPEHLRPAPGVQVGFQDSGVLSGKRIQENNHKNELLLETTWGQRLRIPDKQVREVLPLPVAGDRLVGGPLRLSDWEIDFDKRGYNRTPRPPLEVAGSMQVFALTGTTLARRIPYHPRTRTRIRFHLPPNTHPSLTMTFFSERKKPYGTGAMHVIHHGKGLTLIPFSSPYGGFDPTGHATDAGPPTEIDIYADRVSGLVSVVANGKTVRTWNREPADPDGTPEAEWFILSGRASPFYIDRFEVETWDGRTFPEPLSPLPPPEEFRNRIWLRLPATGDLLTGSGLEFNGREFVLTSDSFPGGLHIPADRVGLVTFHSPATLPRKDPDLAHGHPWELAVKSGVRFPVSIDAWTPDGLTVRSDWSPRPFRVKREHIQELLHTDFSPGGRVPALRIHYRDGSRLAADPKAVSGREAAFTSPWGQTLTSSAGRMSRWDQIGRRKTLVCSLGLPGGVMGYSGRKEGESFQDGLPFLSNNTGIYMGPKDFPNVFRIGTTLESNRGPLHFGMNFWGKNHSWEKPDWLSIKLEDGPEPWLEFETAWGLERHPLPLDKRGMHDFEFRLDLEKGRAQVWVDGGFRFETRLPEGFRVDVDKVYLYDRNWTSFWIHDFRLYRLPDWPEKPDPEAAASPVLQRIRNGALEVTVPPDPRIQVIPVDLLDRIVFPMPAKGVEGVESDGMVEIMAPWAGTRLRLRELESDGDFFTGKSPNWKEELRIPEEAVARIRFAPGLPEDETGLWPWVPLLNSAIELEKEER